MSLLKQHCEEWNLTNVQLLDCKESRTVYRCNYNGSKACLGIFLMPQTLDEERSTQALLFWDGEANAAP